MLMNFCEDVRSHRQLWVDSHIPSVGIVIHAASKGLNDAKKKKDLRWTERGKVKSTFVSKAGYCGKNCEWRYFSPKILFSGPAKITIADRLPVFVDAYCSLLGVRVNKTTSLTQFQNWRTNPGRLAQKWNLVISNLLCDGWCVDDKQVHFAV